MRSRMRSIAALVSLLTVAITARAQVMEKKTLTIDGARKVIQPPPAHSPFEPTRGGCLRIKL